MDQAEGLREWVSGQFGANATKQPLADPLNYRELWEGLKAEIEREAEGVPVGYAAFPHPGQVWKPNETARAFLDRMEQAETLARYVKPAQREGS